MDDPANSEPLTVWYNTLCPVCRRGIDLQKALMTKALRDGTVEFRDINLEPEVLAGMDTDLESVRKRLHATTPDGGVLKGADVVVAIFKKTVGLRWLGGLLGLPVIRSLVRIAYDGFAALVYAYNRREGRW